MKVFRLLSLSSLLAWLEFLSRTITNTFRGSPLPSPPHGKGMNILDTIHHELLIIFKAMCDYIDYFFLSAYVMYICVYVYAYIYRTSGEIEMLLTHSTRAISAGSGRPSLRAQTAHFAFVGNRCFSFLVT